MLIAEDTGRGLSPENCPSLPSGHSPGPSVSPDASPSPGRSPLGAGQPGSGLEYSGAAAPRSPPGLVVGTAERPQPRPSLSLSLSGAKPGGRWRSGARPRSRPSRPPAARLRLRLRTRLGAPTGMAAVLESLLREEVSVAAMVQWIARRAPSSEVTGSTRPQARPESAFRGRYHPFDPLPLG